MIAPSSISGRGVEVLDLRHFSAAELRPLLQHEIRLWSDSLFWDYRGPGDMILRYVDAKILPGYAAIDQEGVRGYCFFVYEGSKAVIGDLFVKSEGPAARAADREIEDRLLTHTIATLQQSPGIQRIEAQLLLHASGEVAPTFQAHAFSRHPRLFMLLPLKESALPANRRAGRPAPPAEIEIRRWSDQDYQPAAGLITAAYRGHVDADINDQYRSSSGSLRFLNNIVRFPGCGQFDGQASFVAIHRVSRAMVGLVLCSRVRDDVGHVTQVCVLPEHRGRHLGEALLAATANELRRRNFGALTLTVTEANRGAVRLYQQLGYGIHRVFDAFVWVS